jgi:hypothetical protein
MAGDRLTLKWEVPGAKPFPLPVEVQVGERMEVLPMVGGTGSVVVGPGEHVVIDPMSKLLKQDDAIDAYQAFRAKPPQR